MSQQIDELFDVFEDAEASLSNDTNHIKVDTLQVNVKQNIDTDELLNKKSSDKNKPSDILVKKSQTKSEHHEEYCNGDVHLTDDKQDGTRHNRINKERDKDVLDNTEVEDNFNIRIVVGGQELEKIVGERVKSKIYNKEKKNDDTQSKTQNKKKIRKLEEMREKDQTNDKEEEINMKEQSNGKYCSDIRDLLVQEHPIEFSKTLKDGNSLILEEFISDTNCMHKCVRPEKYVHKILTEPLIPARTYKFRLDTFQKKSIECLERSESVLVSAHTSAGKTVIAEYAIALGLRDKQRVIYTSPIKALSNQKYRDLHEEFEDVGLITGDISINPEASIIVMTTEILRSMLYRGAALTKEVRWVIFDEIHYMRDRDRGVIWEETIILLPLMVRFIFLSATIPNGIQFAEWVSTIKNQACHIIYTDYRPTPLQHYAYPTGKESVILICDEHGQFLKENFMEAANSVNDEIGNGTEDSVNTASLGNKKTNRNANKNINKMKKRTGDIEKIVKMCHSRHYTPLIVFSFSKKECEMNANSIAKIDLTDESEKAIIQELFKNAIQILSDDDRHLPQIKYILPLLMRGIGIHHGGLLPIIKEIIEIMFQESLLKVLFSTETFSMGINMPAKTVVFTSLEKFDGVEKRTINSGEYIQMAGRAGRRGLDDRGIVIIILDKYIHWKDAEQLFIGESNRLNSQFHLGYNMILNLLRIEGVTPDYMIERSFMQYQTKKRMYEHIAIKNKIEKEMNRLYTALSNIYVNDKGQEIHVPLEDFTHSSAIEDMEQEEINTNNILKKQETEQEHMKRNKDQMAQLEKLKNCTSVFSCISQYYSTKKKLLELGNRYRHFLTQQKVIIPFLCKGRLVFIEENGIVWGWCVFIEGRIIRSKRVKPKVRPGMNGTDHNSNDVGKNKTSEATNDEDGVVVIDCWVPYIPDKKRNLEESTQEYTTEEEEEDEEDDDEERDIQKEETIEKKKNIHECNKKKYNNIYNCNRKEIKEKNNKTNVNETTTSFLDVDEHNSDITTIDEEEDTLDLNEGYDKCGCSELDDIYAIDDFEDEQDDALVGKKSYILAYATAGGRPVPPSHRKKKNVRWKKMTFFLKSVYRLSAAILSVPSDIDLKNDSGVSTIKERYNALMDFVKEEKLLPIININKLKVDDDEILEVIKNINHCEQLLLNNKLRKNKKFNKFYLMYLKYIVLQFEKNEVDNSILKCRNIVLKKELKKMLNLMENMKYIEVTQRMNFTNDKRKMKKEEETGGKTEEEKGKEKEENEAEKNEKTEKQEETSQKQEKEVISRKVETTVLSPQANSLYEHQEITRNKYKETKAEKGYIVTMKGQIASAISSVDELVIAELFFSNFFSQYGAEYIAAFLSCFVFDENKTTEVPILDKILVEGHKIIIETAKRIAREMEKCDMTINLNEYLEKFKPEIMTTVLSWMKGSPFSQLQMESHIYEGSIIRTLRRLDELLRQMICAFRGISNEYMCEFLLNASKILRRGIPFSPSLYL